MNHHLHDSNRNGLIFRFLLFLFGGGCILCRYTFVAGEPKVSEEKMKMAVSQFLGLLLARIASTLPAQIVDPCRHFRNGGFCKESLIAGSIHPPSSSHKNSTHTHTHTDTHTFHYSGRTNIFIVFDGPSFFTLGRTPWLHGMGRDVEHFVVKIGIAKFLNQFLLVLLVDMP